MVEEDLGSEGIALCYRHVEGRVVVNAALIRVCTERQQQPDDLGHIGPSWRSGRIVCATQSSDERRKTIMHRRVGISADLQQGADEMQRAVVDRVNQA